ncbi:MAG TPA: DinB family protein [Acidobacteriaceae bacterium]
MSTEVGRWFRAELTQIRADLCDAARELADVPWRAGGWTRKQIVGHMLDSATNNRQRFVRASTEKEYSGPQYDQDAWVAAHGYGSQSWETLLGWWSTEHAILAAVVDNIGEEQLAVSCTVGDAAPVTLRFLIEDYIAHQKWHLNQICAGAKR